MFCVLLAFIQLFIIFLVGNCTKANIDNCKQAVTRGYGYKVMYHIREGGEYSDNHLILKFYVKSASDAHILLATSDSPTESDPSYEIVLGAGRNTFSDIRNKGRKAVGVHIGTPGILSSDEYRGFWIKLSPLGHLEVGEIGNEAPIMVWNDPQPLKIQYFGFCGWSSFIGYWAYNCPEKTRDYEMSANLTALDKLRIALLTNYDPYNRPVIEATDITTVYLQLQNKAVKLNEKQSTMYVMADVNMQWQDQKMQWDINQYGNVSKLIMAYREIWQPELMLFNAVGSGTGFLMHEMMSVTPVGSVKWKAHMDVEVHCNLDLSEWPYDKQVCELQLGFWADQKYLRLLYGNEPEDYSQQTNSEWEILKLRYENIHIQTPWTDTSKIPKEAAMAIRYELKRSNFMYRAVFGVPLLAISIMTLLPFWISPLSANKLHISCLGLIVMSIFVIVLARTLPAPADHVPILVETYSRGMVAVTFSILISVGMITMARSKHDCPVPQVIKYVINRKYIQFILFISAIPNKDPSDYGNLLESDIPDQQGSDSTAASDDTQQWILLAQLIDRISFIIYFIYLCTIFFRQI